MNELWYDKPARHWREALPLGNGHTGVMVYGGKSRETLCFNDSTLWSGYPKNYNSEESLRYLDKVRELIFDGKNNEADCLAQEKLKGFYSETFLPLGTVKIKLSGLSGQNYRRSLDLNTAIHTVKTSGVRRESFVSFPDKIAVYHMQADRPFQAEIAMSCKLHAAVSADTGLNLVGNAPDYAAPNYLRKELFPLKYNEGKAMAFALRCEADTDGVLKRTKTRLYVENATHLTLYFATATGFAGYNKMPETNRMHVLQKCKTVLKNISRDYNTLKNRHISDFSDVFEKSTVSFFADTALSTDRLLDKAKTGDVTPALISLFYNYGKYMLAAGSREGAQPLNLQGQWNNARRPPWSSNYTVNINTQMNYWGASRANMDACLEPLLRMVYETMQNGKITAKTNYGCAGFACNHNVDIWRKTPPVQGTCNYMLEPLCGVWLANELYTHYKNGCLQAYEKQVLEITREAAQFAADYLVLHNGQYVICPSPSAENRFTHNGKNCTLDYASAFDMGLVRQVFSNYMQFNTQDALHTRIQTILPQLYAFQTDENGICEWHKAYDRPEPGHRHFSPLYAFYPGTEIQYYKDAALTQAVKTLFLDRICRSTQYIGWSAAWGICLAARLHDAQNVQMITQKFLGHAVFKNLFCVHPPHYFQIDGNLGFVAGIHEMLLYTENGKIELLPALPDNLPNGKAENLLVNGVLLSFSWERGQVTQISANGPVQICASRLSENCKISENIRIEGE